MNLICGLYDIYFCIAAQLLQLAKVRVATYGCDLCIFSNKFFSIFIECWTLVVRFRIVWWERFITVHSRPRYKD